MSYYYSIACVHRGENILLIAIAFDNGPSPSTLVAKVVTVISIKGGQDDEETFNS